MDIIDKFADIKVGDIVYSKAHFGGLIKRVITRVTPKQFFAGDRSWWKRQGRPIGRNQAYAVPATDKFNDLYAKQEAKREDDRKQAETQLTNRNIAVTRAKREIIAAIRGSTVVEPWLDWIDNNMIGDDGRWNQPELI